MNIGVVVPLPAYKVGIGFMAPADTLGFEPLCAPNTHHAGAQHEPVPLDRRRRDPGDPE